MKKVTYSVENKNKVIEVKIQGYSTKLIMEILDKLKLGVNKLKLMF
ncbi:hypothetical protein M4L90_07165 [Staphylococcus equorum]|uniref:Uncharacterized protein n=1 Tax=Staphylococcus equorum TaxID=246432 RepID=A0A9X4L415_9STAP|nr:hypothetical protein [Staphylococcus equorum]MDG0819679.1 hypothetical protein [Staphylococcus equorum]MDG0840320.1 hypothetical protein [Staphylococcus equorum]MDG0846003.1 hypothetical protein [Staphylococcus equorum]